MKITILSPNLSNNSLARVYTLGKVLDRIHKVEIVGFKTSSKVWPAANTGAFDYWSVQARSMPFFVPQSYRLVKKIKADVIYAHKPLFTSFGISLFKKLGSSCPVILDIDDWELGFCKTSLTDSSFFRRSKHILGLMRGAFRSFKNPFCYSYPYVWTTEKLIPLADKITVSNRFLQGRFGGTIVYHGRDMNFFDPSRFDSDHLRKKIDIKDNHKIIAFIGTPRPHKGVENLIEALHHLVENESVALLLASLNDNEYVQQLYRKAVQKLDPIRTYFVYMKSYDMIPQMHSIADLVVIPQKYSSSTIGQLPMKVFDAMAMAKPIIATDVSDLPEILDGCGWIVEPENPDQLAEKIQYVLDHPAEANEKGKKAREKCKANYSYEAMEKTLLSIFAQYE